MNMQSGVGGVVIDISVTVMMWVAALLHLAVLRDNSLPESRMAEAARWLIVVGIVGIASLFTAMLFDEGDILLPPVVMIPFGLIALGMIAMALDKLRRPINRRRASDDLDLPTHFYSQVFGGHKP